MAIIHIPTPMRELTGGKAKVEVEGKTVREVVDALDAKFPGLRGRLVEEDRVRAGLAVFVDGANSRRRLRTKVGPESELYFVESLGGGELGPTLGLEKFSDGYDAPQPDWSNVWR